MGLLDFMGNIFSEVCDFVAENPDETAIAIGATLGTVGLVLVAAPTIEGKKTGKAAIVLGATLGGAGLASAAAPVIPATAGSLGLLGVASTGVAINTLLGVALTNASLAAVGGGALAAGGGGMAAGVGTIAIAGTSVGVILSTAVVIQMDA